MLFGATSIRNILVCAGGKACCLCQIVLEVQTNWLTWHVLVRPIQPVHRQFLFFVAQSNACGHCILPCCLVQP